MSSLSATRVRVAAVIAWLVIVVVFFGGLGGAAAALNATLYGPATFVLRYLDAIATDDLSTALAMPGVLPAPVAGSGGTAALSRTLLRPGLTTARPTEIELVSTAPGTDGTTLVTVRYRVADTEYQTTFAVAAAPPLYGVINRWTFHRSPLATLRVNVQHTPSFSVGTVALDARYGKSVDEMRNFNQQSTYLVLGGARYPLTAMSELVSAASTSAVTTPGEQATVTLDAQPTVAFNARVQMQVGEFLASCVAQKVLMPAGCPFGDEINDRLTSEPQWKITQAPQVALQAGDNTFEMPPTTGIAQLTVTVQRLFDGSQKTITKDINFQIAANALIRSDGSIVVELGG